MEFEGISLIVSVATAIGVSYTIIHGILRDKNQKRQETTDLLLKFEERLFQIVTRWQRSEKGITDAIRTTTAYLRILNMICYLYEEEKIDNTSLKYFHRDFSVGKAFRKFIKDCTVRDYVPLSNFDKYIDNPNNKIETASWKLLDPELEELYKKNKK